MYSFHLPYIYVRVSPVSFLYRNVFKEGEHRINLAICQPIVVSCLLASMGEMRN